MSTTPDGFLLIAPYDDHIITGTKQYDMVFALSSNTQNFVFGYSNIQMQISSNGNIGINTSNPSYKLHVNGDMYATGNIIAFSDCNYKTDMQVITDPIKKIKEISGYTFSYKDDITHKRHAGLLAQEVQKILPEVVDSKDDKLGIAYGNVIALLVEAIKDQQKQIDILSGTAKST